MVSICLSVCLTSTNVVIGPGRQEISIDYFMAGAKQQKQVNARSATLSADVGS